MPRKPKVEKSVESTILYNGDVEVRFYPEAKRNRYVVVVDGEETKPPSVTTISGLMEKPALLPWAVGQTLDIIKQCIGPNTLYSQEELEKIFETARKRANTVKKETADIGTLAHKWACAYFQGENPALPDKEAAYRPSVDTVLDWSDKHHIKFLFNERPVYSRQHKIVGTLDGIAEVDGNLELIDFKSGGLYESVFFQTAPYNIAIEEEFPELKLTARRAVRIGRDGNLEEQVSPRKNLERHMGAFLGLKAAYEAAREIRKEMKAGDWLED